MNTIDRLAVIFLFGYYLTSHNTYSQEIPNEFFEHKTSKLIFDSGQNWEQNTSFGPVRYQMNSAVETSKTDSLLAQIKIGMQSINDNVALYGFERLSFNNYFYGYLYSRIVSNAYVFERFTGKPKDIARSGFNSGETDLSGFGFQNENFLLQFGRGRQSWGAGNDIQLVLSESSPAYDYGLIGLDFRNFRFKYINGYLDSDSVGINRYITARGIEFSNLNSFVFSISEIAIYSGLNRPLDIAYLNPISTHLEVEQNDRQNRHGYISGNGVWQVSLDWMLRPNIRLSANLLFDEVVLDKAPKKAGKENGTAHSFRISYTPILNQKSIITSYLSYIKVGTPTFRHGDGNNNFVIRGKPLGWKFGSDGNEIKFGLNYFNLKNLIGNFEIGHRKIGEESIIYSPYEIFSDYLKGKFPSGQIDEKSFFSSNVNWRWKSNLLMTLNLELSNSSLIGRGFEINIGVDISFPKNIRF